MNQQPDTAPTETATDAAAVTALENEIIAALKTVYDPEIPVDIYELGLIYNLDIDLEQRHVDVDMTLTAPGCPVAGAMPEWVREAVESVEGVDSCRVDLVWEPPWRPDLMSMRAKLELNLF
ncbi:MAG: SUF system Fe-S cluster assembly protein [Candidatus Competibacterales bacterium]|nr:SUF system Fe-S cluster assembly protein [Candidatus Competibacterales bacterium]